MKVKTKDLQLAIDQVQKSTGGITYLEVSEEPGKLSISGLDGSGCQHKVTIYDADSNLIAKLTTETKLGGLR